MPYIQNGVVVEGERPITVTDNLTHLVNLVVFFFTSMVSQDPIRQQIDSFNGTRSRNYGGSSNNRLGNGGGGGGGNGRSNINTFGPAVQTGSCGTGG